MAKVPEKIQEVYNINGHKIQVKAEVDTNGLGYYVAKIMYREHKPKEDGYDHYRIEDFSDYTGPGKKAEIKSNGPWRKAELKLNGPGKSKLEKKIGKFLKSKYMKRP